MEGTLAEPTKDTTSPWKKSTGGSPWGKTSPVQPCSLEDVMSEQLATDLQAEEQTSILNERYLPCFLSRHHGNIPVQK